MKKLDSDIDRAAICKRIEQVRLQMGMGQKKFAEYLDLGYTTYRNYEAGRVTIEGLIVLSQKLDLPIEWLIMGEERASRSPVGNAGPHAEIVRKLITVLEKDDPVAKGMLIDTIEGRYKQVAGKTSEDCDHEIKKISRKKKIAV